MSHTDIIKTIVEFAAIVLAIVGMIYEKKVIAFEDALVKAFKAYRRSRRQRRQRELAAERQQRRIQSRAPEDLPDDEQPAPYNQKRQSAENSIKNHRPIMHH